MDRWVASVKLDEPVNGRSETTAYLAHNRDVPTGHRIDVLVNPRDPGYAEVKGSPVSDTSYATYYGIGAAFFGLLTILSVVTRLPGGRRS